MIVKEGKSHGIVSFSIDVAVTQVEGLQMTEMRKQKHGTILQLTFDSSVYTSVEVSTLTAISCSDRANVSYNSC
jgi:hypothetical protein